MGNNQRKNLSNNSQPHPKDELAQFFEDHGQANSSDLTEIAFQLTRDEHHQILSSVNKLSAFKWLIEKGADVNANNGAILFYLVQTPKFIIFLPLLINAKLNIVNEKGVSLFEIFLASSLKVKERVIILFLLNKVDINEISSEVLLNLYKKIASEEFRYSLDLVLIMEWFVVTGQTMLLKNYLADITKNCDLNEIHNAAYSPLLFFMPGLEENDLEFIEKQLRHVFKIAEDKEIDIFNDLSILLEPEIANVDESYLFLKYNDYSLPIAWSHLNQLIKRGVLPEEFKSLITKIKDFQADKKLSIPSYVNVLEGTMKSRENPNYGMGMFNTNKFSDTTFTNIPPPKSNFDNT